MAAAAPRHRAGLEVFVVEDGFLVHDDAAGRVHHLDATSALSCDLCDGSTDLATMAAEVAEAFGLDEPPVDDVAECVAQLTAEGVLESDDAGDQLSGGPEVGPGFWHPAYLR